MLQLIVTLQTVRMPKVIFVSVMAVVLVLLPGSIGRLSEKLMVVF